MLTLRGRRPVPLLKAAVAVAALAGVCACGASDDTDSASGSKETTAASEAPATPSPELRSYVKQELQKLRSDLADSPLDGLYRISMGIEGASTVVQTYDFTSQVDAAEERTRREGQLEFHEMIAGRMVDEMTSLGVEDPAVTWIYKNADGSEIIRFDLP